MGTIVFRVKQGEARFMSSARLLAAETQPEVEIASQSNDLNGIGNPVDVDIFMFNTGKLGKVRVFLRDGSNSDGVIECGDTVNGQGRRHCLSEDMRLEHTHAICHSLPADRYLPLLYDSGGS